MKFLLVGINAKYIHSNPAVYSLKAYAGEGYEKEIEIEYVLCLFLLYMELEFCAGIDGRTA